MSISCTGPERTSDPVGDAKTGASNVAPRSQPIETESPSQTTAFWSP